MPGIAAAKAAPAAKPSPKAEPLDSDEMLKAIMAMEDVGASKEKSVRVKAALNDLQAVAHLADISPGGTVVSIIHRNELTTQFVLVGASYALDDKTLRTTLDDSGDFNLVGEQLVARKPLEPGEHRLAVQYELRGNGFGLLSYLEDIHLTLSQSFVFNVDPRRSTTIEATISSTGSLTRAFKNRPEVTFTEIVDHHADKALGRAHSGSSSAREPASGT